MNAKYLSMSFKVASFFAGAGGLDLGFEQAGFDIVYSNEFDKKITPTLKKILHTHKLMTEILIR